MPILRSKLIRLASALPEGSDGRKAVLDLVTARGIGMNPINEWKGGDDKTKVRVISQQVERASDIMRMVKIMAQKTPGADARQADKLLRGLDDYYLSM